MSTIPLLFLQGISFTCNETKIISMLPETFIQKHKLNRMEKCLLEEILFSESADLIHIEYDPVLDKDNVQSIKMQLIALNAQISLLKKICSNLQSKKYLRFNSVLLQPHLERLQRKLIKLMIDYNEMANNLLQILPEIVFKTTSELYHSENKSVLDRIIKALELLIGKKKILYQLGSDNPEEYLERILSVLHVLEHE